MRRFCLPLLALAALSFPAGASAATFGQVQPLTLRGDEECVFATGAPGELAVPATGGVRFVQATRAGLAPGQTIKLADEFECGTVSVRPSGAGVIAGETAYEARGVVAAVRDPGGAWSAPVIVATAPEEWRPSEVKAAVSDRGDVVVVWRERHSSAGKVDYRFMAARRAPGGPFGAAEQIGAISGRLEQLIPAIATTGEAFALTTSVEGARPPFRVPVSVAIAPPGSPFGPLTLVANTTWRSIPALAAGPDGRALVALGDGTSMIVAERAPGAAFTAGVRIGDASDPVVAASVKLGAGGEAAVAWARPYTGDLQFASRPALGAFTPPATVETASLLPAGSDPFYRSETFFASFLGVGGLGYGSDGFGSIAFTPDGRAAIAWYLLDTRAPGLVTVPLAGGAAATQTAPAGLRAPDAAMPVILSDGTTALAWAEGRRDSSTVFRLHLGADGVTEAPEPPAPRVTVGAPRSRSLRQNQPLRLPVRCDGPCELYAEILGETGVFDSLRLTRAGSGTLALYGAAFTAPRRLGPVRIRLTYRAPSALRTRARTLTVRLVRDRTVPDPRVVGVRAERRADGIRVTWRVTGPIGDESSYYVTGTATRSQAGEPAALREVSVRKRQRSFSVTLRADAQVRFVAVRSPYSVLESAPVIVRVR